MLTQLTFNTCIFQFPSLLPTGYSRYMAQSVHGYLVGKNTFVQAVYSIDPKDFIEGKFPAILYYLIHYVKLLG